MKNYYSRNNRWRKTSRKPAESGQAITFLMFALGIVLLGAVAFSVDMGNMWFHKQWAQNAADAACTAGAMDLLVDNTNNITSQGGFTAGTAFDCNTKTTAAPCKYATLNGYNSSISAGSTSAGNNVYVSFPASVAGVPPGSASFPPAALAPHPWMRVDVLDNVQTYFSGLLSGNTVQPVRAYAMCGTVLATSPIPLIVLNPTVAQALKVQGTPTVAIIGGANRSIQVNSSSATAVSIGGNGGINLECGGKSFTGSVLGSFGGPATETPSAGTCPGTPIPNTFPAGGGGFYPGATGAYQSPSTPISDPFAQVPAPMPPPPPATPADLIGNLNCTSSNIQQGKCTVGYHNAVHGCPNSSGCVLYVYGYYPSGITVKNQTAIFDPGVYYLNGGLALQANSMVRPGTGVGDGTGGTMFYLTGTPPSCSGQTGGICVGSNSGGGTTDAFNTSTVQCPLGPPPDPNLGIPPTLPGNVLLAPCTGPYGDPLGKFHGILFFQDRSSNMGGGWGGGGGFLLAGSMYFHQCNAAGTGVGCGATPTDYNSIFTLQGNSGSSSYVLGEIVTDQLHLAGTPSVVMALNPNAVYDVLKATLLR